MHNPSCRVPRNARNIFAKINKQLKFPGIGQKAARVLRQQLISLHGSAHRKTPGIPRKSKDPRRTAPIKKKGRPGSNTGMVVKEGNHIGQIPSYCCRPSVLEWQEHGIYSRRFYTLFRPVLSVSSFRKRKHPLAFSCRHSAHLKI